MADVYFDPGFKDMISKTLKALRVLGTDTNKWPLHKMLADMEISGKDRGSLLQGMPSQETGGFEMIQRFSKLILRDLIMKQVHDGSTTMDLLVAGMKNQDKRVAAFHLSLYQVFLFPIFFIYQAASDSGLWRQTASTIFVDEYKVEMEIPHALKAVKSIMKAVKWYQQEAKKLGSADYFTSLSSSKKTRFLNTVGSMALPMKAIYRRSFPKSKTGRGYSVPKL